MTTITTLTTASPIDEDDDLQATILSNDRTLHDNIPQTPTQTAIDVKVDISPNDTSLALSRTFILRLRERGAANSNSSLNPHPLSKSPATLHLTLSRQQISAKVGGFQTKERNVPYRDKTTPYVGSPVNPLNAFDDAINAATGMRYKSSRNPRLVGASGRRVQLLDPEEDADWGRASDIAQEVV